MKYCKKCVQPDTRPNTYFTEDGICPACIYFDELTSVDWQYRIDTLLDLVKNFPKSNRHNFDCIIGVSGGKDSVRQALFIRDKLGLNPLLACLSYPPEQVTQRGVNNLSMLINLGFDCVVSNPAPETWRKLMRHGFDRFSNYAKSTELALYSSVPQLAIQYNIPLVFWGENPGLQLGDLKTLGKKGYDGNNLRNMNTLAGGNMDWIKSIYKDPNGLNPYIYPDQDEFKKSKIQIIYLGWFLGDWSLVNNAYYSCLDGLEIREDTVENTGDLYGVTSLDEDWVTLNQMIKYYKYGFGRVTDYVNEGIRNGDMTREKGIKLVERFDDSCSDNYIKSFSDYIGITVEQFWKKVRDNVNLDLFTVSSNGEIKKKFIVGKGL